MSHRKTENVTRAESEFLRLRSIFAYNHELYEQISDLAVRHFNAKIHHRSQKPEVTPTILELIKIGIAHLESTLPVTENVTAETVTEELQQQIVQLDSRLTTVESKLSELNTTAPIAESNSRVPNRRKPGRSSKSSRTVREEPTKYGYHEDEVLTDMELSNILNVSNLLIRDYRVYGKKPRGQVLAKALTEEWEVRDEGWIRKKTTR